MVWSREYNRVIERFYKTISAQFHGHTHRNEVLTITKIHFLSIKIFKYFSYQLHVTYDRQKAVYALSTGWNAGSITPFSDVNPNYMIYYVDNEIFVSIKNKFK